MSDISLELLKGKRIDIIAPPFCGHIYPLIPLARRLQNEGARIRFITGPTKIALLKTMGFHAVSILNHLPSALEDIANTNGAVRSNIFKLLRQLRENINLMPIVITELRNYFTSDKPELVIADSIATVAGIISREFGIIWINTIATPFALENSQGTPAYLGGLSPATNLIHHARDWIGRKIITIFKHLIFTMYKRDLKNLGVTLYRKDGSEAIYSPYSILGFGLYELEFKRDWPDCFKMIGPVLEAPEASFQVKIHLPENKKLILVTLGTHLKWAKNNLVEKLKPLMNSCPELYFCISLGSPENFNSAPIMEKDNFSVYHYIPYSSEIDNFVAVIHHGGAGITYSCIAAKKPSLVIPHDYDQFDFAQRITTHKLGLALNNFSDKNAAPMLREVLDPKWKPHLDAMSSALKKYTPEETILSEVLRHLQPLPLTNYLTDKQIADT